LGGLLHTRGYELTRDGFALAPDVPDWSTMDRRPDRLAAAAHAS
jgi:hypothetical protein